MATNSGRRVSETFKNILNIDNSNQGVDGTLRDVQDGEGTVSALQLSTTGVKSTGTLTVVGAASFAAATFTGNLTLTGVSITGGTFEGGALGSVTPYTIAKIDNVVIDGNTISSSSGALTLTSTTTMTLTSSGAMTLTVNAGASALNINSVGIGLTADQPILDSSGNEYIKFSKTASAVNELTVSNAATTGAVGISATGSDTNIGLSIASAGTGQINIVSRNTTTPFVLYSGTNIQHVTSFTFSNTSASRTVTFQDASYTVVGRDTTDILTNKTLTTPTINQPIINGVTDGSSAAVGVVGEIITGTATGVSLVTSTAKTITSISLTAGDWDISAEFTLTPAGTPTVLQGSISATNNTLAAPLAIAESLNTLQYTFVATGAQVFSCKTASVSLSATTTYYAVVSSAFSSTATAGARLTARRRR